MTPEERAVATAELLRPYFRDTLSAWEPGVVAEIIAAAIREAVAAERERRARMVDQTPLACDEEWTLQRLAEGIRGFHHDHP